MADLSNIIGVVILVFFCLTISIWEKKEDGTYITPFSVLVWPYVIVVVMVNCFAVHFKFYPIKSICLMFGLACFVFFLIGGRLVMILTRKGAEPACIATAGYRDDLDELFNLLVPLFVACSIISLVASAANFYIAFKGVGTWKLVSLLKFKLTYGSGLLGHVMQLNRPAFTFLTGYYLYSRSKKILVLLVLIMVSLLLLQMKSHILTTLLSGFIFSHIIGLLHFNWKKIIAYVLAVFILFNIVYLIGYSRIGVLNALSGAVPLYLLNLFFTYLFGGAIGFGKIYNSALYPLYSVKEIFTVPINLYNVFYADKEVISVVIGDWSGVSQHFRYFHLTNVYTFWGTLYMYLGTYVTFLLMFITGMVSYGIRYVASKKNAYVGFQMTYTVVLSFLLFSFFAIFINQLQIYESSFLMLVLPAFYAIAVKFIKKLLSLRRLEYI